MTCNAIIEHLEQSLYAYDIKAYSEGFVQLSDCLGRVYADAEESDRSRLNLIIERLFSAFQKKDYRLALEIAKYELNTKNGVY